MKLQLQNQAQHICMLSFIYTYLPNKKNKIRLPLKLSQLRGSRPKSARPAPNGALDFIQIGSHSAEL